MQSKFGTCSICGSNLVPVWFTEEQTEIIDGSMHKTGKKKEKRVHI